MDFLISCHVLKSTHSYNKAMHGTVEKGRDFKSKADADFIHSFIHFFFKQIFLKLLLCASRVCKHYVRCQDLNSEQNYTVPDLAKLII